jgi:hypothetical protein
LCIISILHQKFLTSSFLKKIHTYIAIRPLLIGIGRDHFFPFVTILTHLSFVLLPPNSSYMIAEGQRSNKELHVLVVCALRRVIAVIKQRWSVLRWVTKNLLSWAPPCFRRHVKPLVSAAFIVVSTHQPALGSRSGLWLICNP